MTKGNRSVITVLNLKNIAEVLGALKIHVDAYSVGYGVRPSHRDGGSADNKGSQRFAPYGDKDTGKVLKNIVPAPPKELDVAPIAFQSNVTGSSIGPKRKRKEEVESPKYFQQPGIYTLSELAHG